MTTDNDVYPDCCPECGGSEWKGCGCAWHDTAPDPDCETCTDLQRVGFPVRHLMHLLAGRRDYR